MNDKYSTVLIALFQTQIVNKNKKWKLPIKRRKKNAPKTFLDNSYHYQFSFDNYDVNEHLLVTFPTACFSLICTLKMINYNNNWTILNIWIELWKQCDCKNTDFVLGCEVYNHSQKRGLHIVKQNPLILLNKS